MSMTKQYTFPKLKKVLKDFCRKNKLKSPEKITQTDDILIATWDNNDQAALFIKPDESTPCDWNRFRPYVGGDGTHSYTSIEQTYILIGVIKGKPASLEAKVSYSEDYKIHSYRPKDLCSHAVLRVPRPTGNNNTTILREDNEEYWFLRNKYEKF